jgi:hypothetical protein
MDELAALVQYYETLAKTYESQARHVEESRRALQQTIRVMDSTYLRIMRIGQLTELQGNLRARQLIQSITEASVPAPPVTPTLRTTSAMTTSAMTTSAMTTSAIPSTPSQNEMTPIVSNLFNSLFSSLFNTNGNANGNDNINNDNTNEQIISNESRIIRYGDIENPISEQCPISLEPFSENELVTQLNHCGHIFRKELFDAWFQNHTQCPVCRYNVVDNSSNNVTENIRNSLADLFVQHANMFIERSPQTNVANTIRISIDDNNIANQLIQQLMSNGSQTYDYDPESGQLYFETEVNFNINGL